MYQYCFANEGMAGLHQSLTCLCLELRLQSLLVSNVRSKSVVVIFHDISMTVVIIKRCLESHVLWGSGPASGRVENDVSFLGQPLGRRWRVFYNSTDNQSWPYIYQTDKHSWHMLQKLAQKINSIFPAPVSCTCLTQIWDGIRLVPETGID